MSESSPEQQLQEKVARNMKNQKKKLRKKAMAQLKKNQSNNQSHSDEGEDSSIVQQTKVYSNQITVAPIQRDLLDLQQHIKGLSKKSLQEVVLALLDPQFITEKKLEEVRQVVMRTSHETDLPATTETTDDIEFIQQDIVTILTRQDQLIFVLGTTVELYKLNLATKRCTNRNLSTEMSLPKPKSKFSVIGDGGSSIFVTWLGENAVLHQLRSTDCGETWDCCPLPPTAEDNNNSNNQDDLLFKKPVSPRHINSPPSQEAPPALVDQQKPSAHNDTEESGKFYKMEQSCK